MLEFFKSQGGRQWFAKSERAFDALVTISKKLERLVELWEADQVVGVEPDNSQASPEVMVTEVLDALARESEVSEVYWVVVLHKITDENCGDHEMPGTFWEQYFVRAPSKELVRAYVVEEGLTVKSEGFFIESQGCWAGETYQPLTADLS